jgi:hypothetical protein
MFRRSYRELIQIPTFEDRFEYLKLSGQVGEATFGFDRYLNQRFYQSKEWRQLRHKVIARDNACDMAFPDYDIPGLILIHHINPISVEDIEKSSDALFDMDNVVCVSYDVHNAIHFGDASLIPKPLVERKPNDTIPWR